MLWDVSSELTTSLHDKKNYHPSHPNKRSAPWNFCPHWFHRMPPWFTNIIKVTSPNIHQLTTRENTCQKLSWATKTNVHTCHSLGTRAWDFFPVSPHTPHGCGWISMTSKSREGHNIDAPPLEAPTSIMHHARILLGTSSCHQRMRKSW
jgi:hypothetical protein